MAGDTHTQKKKDSETHISNELFFSVNKAPSFLYIKSLAAVAPPMQLTIVRRMRAYTSRNTMHEWLQAHDAHDAVWRSSMQSETLREFRAAISSSHKKPSMTRQL